MVSVVKVCAFEHSVGLSQDGVAIISPMWKKFAKYVDDFRFWSIGEASKCPDVLGKRFPIHVECHEPYCWDFYFLQKRAGMIRMEYRDQLDEMTAIMGDRKYLIMDSVALPPRTIPWSTRRNAWTIRDGKIIDRQEIITKQEIALTLAWMHKIAIEDGDGIPGHLMKIILTDGRKYLKPGEIEPHVAEWRRSSACWPDSRFVQPMDARFDVRLFGEVAA